MTRAHKEETRPFRLADGRLCSVAALVADDDGNDAGILLTITGAVREPLPSYVTRDRGSSFYATALLDQVVCVGDEREEDPERVGLLRVALGKWRDAVMAGAGNL
ncbi:MAG: hypothetical protein ACLP3K_04060 [Candidatus Acidiferrales bacterium]